MIKFTWVYTILLNAIRDCSTNGVESERKNLIKKNRIFITSLCVQIDNFMLAERVAKIAQLAMSVF